MKKRLPELCQRLSALRKGEKVDYDVTDRYKNIESETLKHLLQMPDDDEDIYFSQK